VSGATAASRWPAAIRMAIEVRTLRLGGRLEGPVGDVVVPVVASMVVLVAGLFAGWGDLARPRVPGSWAASLQGVWLLAEGLPPLVTAAEGQHLVADRLALVWLPLGLLGRWFPGGDVLVATQAVGLASGVFALWRLARIDASLRVGAATAVVGVYVIAPVVGALLTGGFHPASLALPALLWAAHLGLSQRGLVWVAVVCALAAGAEMGLFVAGLGVSLALVGRRRPGWPMALVGLGWWVAGVTVLQPWLSGGAPATSAYAGYGSSWPEVGVELVTHPVDVLRTLAAAPTVEVILVTLGPMLFLPVLAPRLLVGAVPAQGLVLLGNPDGSMLTGQAVPLAVFALVALPFGLERLGRPGAQRTRVDRRLIVALSSAALVFFLSASPLSPS
jgi:uncharacterized membrane protein